MAGINFEGLTPKNEALRELAELIFLNLQEEDKLGQLVVFMTKQKNGKKVGFVGKPGLLGKASEGCNPTYDKHLTPASEKTWDIKEWQISETICYEDLIDTIAQHFAQNGTDVADLTSTEYMDEIVKPMLEDAIADLIVRLAFFGDKEIAAGDLKDGVDVESFNLINGIWKQLFEAVTAKKTYRVAIAANEATTVDAQYEAMLQAGAATKVLNDLIIRTPAKLRNLAGRRFIVTQAFADCLSQDIQSNNKGSDLQWEAIFAGIRRTQYQGVEVLAVPQFDEIIQSYLKNTTNAGAYDKPFRVIYGVKDNFRVGTESAEQVAKLDVWFEKKDQANYILAKDTIGALVVADEYAAVAY
ncbi:MAG: hypothetical protein II205_04400 [Bacteroidales bacterium]|nr:hypothetical protein [Bacteroidales bacterium]